MKRVLVAGLISVFLVACGGDELGSSGNSEGGNGAGTTTTTQTTSPMGGGGAGGNDGGSGGAIETTTSVSALETLLNGLRNDLQGTLLAQSAESGWPAKVEGGYLFVNTNANLNKVAGDHDGWAGTDLKPDQGFLWVVMEVADGNQYKFTNLSDYAADPWARSYTFDNFGEMSLVRPKTAHLDRFFKVGDVKMEPRTIRILVPAKAPTHVLYMHDGQNLFDPEAFFGGWKIQSTAPDSMLIVGIDNTPARMDEYTHVPDKISGAGLIGGLGDAYGDFLQGTIRPLVKKHYGEPPVIGTMGSSLGGLISLHIADKFPGEYTFSASLSGTLGWGSIGNGVHNETMIERYEKHGHQSTVLYVDSGGDGGPCDDTDNDGVDDDLDGGDNFCENAQLFDTLLSIGYTENQDLHYVWAVGEQHNEAAWAARVQVPLGLFAGLK